MTETIMEQLLNNSRVSPSDITIHGKVKPEYAHILTVEALSFLEVLHRCFEGRRQELLNRRKMVQSNIDNGIMPDFLPETKHIRADKSWKGASPAPGLIDRRVEITGPVDRKMVINALNSEATQFMADFEDSSSPTWSNMIEGQVNLYDAVRRSISFVSPEGREYKLKESKLPTLLVRPRGWHLNESHILVNRAPISASLFDFGMFFFHNAREAMAAGFGPYFYLPKLENHLEARLWNDVFNVSQDYLGIPRGSIRATVLIETILAAFEMEEIIFELRDHSAGLNCGRWDYIFSYIKKFRSSNRFILPDRSCVTMTVPFMASYVALLINTCHRRGVHAMGGMAAQIPIKNDLSANRKAMERVREDKMREAKAGHDGTWVAHPDLIPIAMDVFNNQMPQPNQIFVKQEESNVKALDLISPPISTPITREGIRENVTVALVYIESWLRGQGCVPINYLMEDAATAEIARSQLWQWIHHKVSTTDTGELITIDLVSRLMDERVQQLNTERPTTSYEKAKSHLLKLVKDNEFIDFLTLLCYDEIVHNNEPKSKL